MGKADTDQEAPMYTSGRTVKTRQPAAATPVAAATKATRQAIKTVIGNADGVTISSRQEFSAHRKAHVVVTQVTYPAGTKHAALRAHIMAEVDTLDVTAAEHGMTIWRGIA